MTKAIILGKVANSNKYTIRVPYFESAGGSKSIFEATLCTNPSTKEEYKEGDVVFVAFEDGEIEKAVILGGLSLLGNLNEPRGHVCSEALTVTGSAILPANTMIGDFALPDLQNAFDRFSENSSGSSSSVEYADKAGYATKAGSADNATSSTTSDTATKAIQDGLGNIIASTYVTQQSLGDQVGFSYDSTTGTLTITPK